MFGTFKKLFRKDTEQSLATSIPERSEEGSFAEPVAAINRIAPGGFTSPSPFLASSVRMAETESDTVTLPLKSVFACLPSSLSSIVQSQGSGFVSLPSQRIAQELPKGCVKLAFGEVRLAAPAGTFFDNARHDQVLIQLPLNEILLRMPASLLSRRPDQKQISLPAEVTNIFGPRGEGLSLLSTKTMTGAPKAQPPAVAAPELKPMPTPVALPRLHNPMEFKAPVAPVIPPLEAIPFKVVPTETGEKIVVAMASLSDSWPEIIRQEIAANMSIARVSLPMDQIEQGLKAGRIVLGWKQLCEWTQPRLTHVLSEDLPLELPLKVIAPLFMAKYRPKAQKKVIVGDFPDLFASPNSASVAFSPAIAESPSLPVVMPQPETVSAPAPIVVPFSEANSERVDVVKRNLSPAQIVNLIAKWEGVSGAFIAMQDGLLVAADLPSDLKGDTVAAFLPQIFGRMNQYAKELQLGVLSSFTFVVDAVPWQIIKTGAVYLVAVGKPGENLPNEKLNSAAVELKIQ